jgi:hypothetical protein
MKKYIINKYYDFIIWLEDIFSNLGTKINNHRKKIEGKYWEKYLS